MNGTPDNSSNKEAISPTIEQSKLGVGCILGFFALFLLVSMLISYLAIIAPCLKARASLQWQPTPCTVVASRVEHHRHNKGGVTYSVDVTYEYEFKGQKYESKQYDFSIPSSSGLARKTAIVAQHPPGLQTTCFVNPANATQAVISREYPIEIGGIIFVSIFLLVGLGGIVAILLTARARKRSEQAKLAWPESTYRNQDASLPSPSTNEIPVGPVTLKPTTSPLNRFIAGVIFAVIWNGVISVFVVGGVLEPPKGFFGWMLLLFMVPFILIGLALIANVVYAFCAMFNPRPTLIVNATTIQLGFPLEISWQFSGSTNSVRQLQIFLEGMESARYRRGTSTSTDTSVFAKVMLLNTQLPAEIPIGKASVTVPFGTMHSWDGGNNKIEWSLHVVGDIKFWPDVNETFPIQILPVRLS